MRKILVVLLLISAVVSGDAIASERWDSATNTGQEATGDAMLTRCYYRTLGGYQFSIVVRGICPFSVQVNPETGQVKR